MNVIIEQCGNVNNYVLLAIFSCLIILPVISYIKYGVKSYILPDDFEKIGRELPYWFTSIRTIYNCLAFTVFLGLVAKAIKSERQMRYFWLTLSLVILPFGAYFGRRFFLNMIIMGTVIWLTRKEENIFQLKYLKFAAILLVGALLVSNVYQTYRKYLIDGINLQRLGNPIYAALDFRATLGNLKIRPGTWEFNYLVLEKQTKESEKITKGKIFWEGFKSSIPRLFWPGKNFLVIDEIVAKLYGVTTKDVDIGKNNFGVFQLEIGYLSTIIYPIIIALIFVTTAGLMKLTLQYPTFSWLFSGNTIHYLINIEENGNEIFFFIRNILIILFMLTGFIIIKWIYFKGNNST
jgi:hypothetical protein